MIQFRDLHKDYSIYVLDKESAVITASQLTKEPSLETDFSKPFNQPQRTNITIMLEGIEKTFTMNDNLSVAYANNIVIATERVGLKSDLEAMKTNAESIINSVDKQKEILAKVNELLEELNPAEKERRKLEERLQRLEDMLTKLVN